VHDNKKKNRDYYLKLFKSAKIHSLIIYNKKKIINYNIKSDYKNNIKNLVNKYETKI
jgi:hypothetical protein